VPAGSASYKKITKNCKNEECTGKCKPAIFNKEETIMAAEVENMFYVREAPWHGLAQRCRRLQIPEKRCG
jgi:hypothetical protein